jgi:protein-arginine kinase activator protein McsA
MSAFDRVQGKLQKAIEEEDYETAARLRDELARLKGDN